MSFELMKARIAQSGVTLYDEQIKDAQDILSYGFKDDVSYNPYMVDYDTGNSIMIKIYNQRFTASYGFAAQFLAPHNMPVELGDLLYDTKRNDYWLCVESYDVDDIHNEGRLGKCGRFLKWQDKNGIIRQTPMIVTSASKYNNGEDGITVLQVGSDQLMVYLQLNEDTVLLDRGMRFFVDENRYNPSVYELTRNDTALYSYMGKGFLSLILTECAYTPTEKEFELGVCDYVEPKPYEPLPVPEDKSSILSANIVGKSALKLGFSRTYSAEFLDKDGKNVDWYDVEFEWFLDCEFADQITQDAADDKIKLSVDNEELLGASFLLQVRLKPDDTADVDPDVPEGEESDPVVIGQMRIDIVEGW